MGQALQPPASYVMFRTYLRQTLRDLLSNKGYFVINLLGLITGITAFILIVLWIRTETSYDRFHRHAEDIYRVDYLLYEEGVLEQHSASGSHSVGREIMNMFPEAVDYTRFLRQGALVKCGEVTFKERNVLYTESSFFDLFDFPLAEGVADSTILAQVSNVTSSSCVPGMEITNSRVLGIPVEGRNTEKKIEMYYIDDHFFDTYGITLNAGNNFESTMWEDTGNVIINEAALPYFGFEEPAATVGEILRGGRQMVHIKAVVRDFNQEYLKELPYPLAFFNFPANQYYTVRASMSDLSGLIAGLEKIWEAHYEGIPFHYFFMDQFYDEQYRGERRFSSLFLASSLLAIFLACLGLSGLSAFSIIRRTKEIGIRKTNGAGTGGVMVLLNRNFMTWVIIGFVIACPLAWFAMGGWLANFAYRTGLSWWIFALAGIAAMLVALITVSWQSWRASNMNPADALREE